MPMLLSKRRLLLALVVCFIPLYVNAASDRELADSLVPSDAESLSSQTNAEGFQIYYEIARRFPEVGLIPKWKDAFISAGWRVCEKGNDWSEMLQWSQHVDATKQPHQIIKQYMAVFTNGSSAALVVARYRSAFDRVTAGNLNSLPDNDHQMVNLLFFQGRDSVSEISRIYKVNCK